MGPKKKKTKAEIAEEKLAKELEDKKQKELEEKRQLVEAERRKIEDVKIQEMRKKIRESELDRLSSESVHRLELLEAFQQRLRYERAQVQERTQWFKFLNPAEDPDPSSERELNTFLSILNELPRSSFANVMHMCSRLEKVATPLRAQWGDDYAKQNYAMQLNSANFLESFSKIVLEQLDQATVNILRLADAHLNDKAELVVEEHSADVYIGLWAYFGTSSLPRKEVKFSKLGFEISVPKQILQNETRFVHRVIRFPLETQSLAAYHPDSSRPEFVGNTSKYVIGDVHIVELLIPPPMSSRIRAKKWVIRDRSAASLKLRKSAYPSTATMKCTIRVPDSLVIGGDVRAMMWSPETSDWTEAGVSEFLWTAAERKVEFYLTALGTVALVRDRVSELPYKHWSLRSLRSAASSQDAHSSPNAPISDVYEQSARLSLWTERMLIVIDIVGDVCRLVQPDDRSTADVVGRDMTPGALCGLLLRRGVNIMPSQHDFARALGSEALVKVPPTPIPPSHSHALESTRVPMEHIINCTRHHTCRHTTRVHISGPYAAVRSCVCCRTRTSRTPCCWRCPE